MSRDNIKIHTLTDPSAPPYAYARGINLVATLRAHPSKDAHYLARKVVDVGAGVIRTVGEPSTMRDLWRRYAAPLRDYGRFEAVSAQAGIMGARAIMAMALAQIGCESVFSKKQGTRDIFSIRFEDDFRGWDDDEHQRWCSFGLAQTTLATARTMQRRYKLKHYDLEGKERLVMPGDLCIPEVSIAYLYAKADHDLQRYGFDLVKLRAAYNAGSALPTAGNAFGYLLHGGDVGFVKFLAWYNDALAVLEADDVA